MELPNTRRVPAQDCPWCGHVLTGLSYLDPKNMAPPEDGDVSVCVYCQGVLVCRESAWARAGRLDWFDVRDQVREIQAAARALARKREGG